MFLTIQDGDYTININAIAEIDWVSGNEEECTVTMVTGTAYTLELEDYRNLKEKLGIE